MTKFSFSAPQTYICELNQYSSVLLLKGKTWQEKLVLLQKYWERKHDSSFEGHSSHFSYIWLFGLNFLFWWLYLLVFVVPLTKISNFLRNTDHYFFLISKSKYILLSGIHQLERENFELRTQLGVFTSCGEISGNTTF